MKHIGWTWRGAWAVTVLAPVLLAGVAVEVAQAQPPASSSVQEVGVCEVINHPARYDGTLVRIKGVVQASFDSLLVRGDTCDSSLWLSYPAGTKAKSGPAAIVTMQLASNATATPGKIRPALTLEKNADWTQFDSLLAQKVKTPGMCLGCVRNNVIATLTGRVDMVEDAGLAKDATGKVTRLDGFGNMNAYTVRLVLQSVTNASAQEIDFSKAPKVKDDSPGGNDKDYVGLTKKAELAFPKGSDAPTQIQRALDAYGAPGVDNGVTVGFGGTADVPADEGAKGAKSSADGLLFTVLFDPDKLKGDTLSRALAHEGSEVASLREPVVASFRIVEQTGWQATLVTLIGARQKSMTLPGGIVLWDENWAQADRTGNASAALNSFIVDHEQAPR